MQLVSPYRRRLEDGITNKDFHKMNKNFNKTLIYKGVKYKDKGVKYSTFPAETGDFTGMVIALSITHVYALLTTSPFLFATVKLFHHNGACGECSG